MLPCNCPSCQTQLKVKSLACENCGTEVHGLYELPVLARLAVDEQDFILKFVKNSGSLKDMAKDLGLSYPTVRNLLDDIIEKLKSYEK
ncbi:DUF2089 family protein [Dysgonomonas sp. 521]|uniref:DUF2089 family protein n=1 Tax=Dysgonomonas sp. 521 TaxID=2302932 RepID=UPI0013D5CAF4|nr:DUF2089 family protein [Dysgonomonas sp. 521]NDV95649.1 DUF2089 family protein [Dysgonomonas sp. 521]